MLQSHYPIYSIKAGSFWEKEYGQRRHPNCTGDIKLYPGCLNFTDKPDNSNVKLHFPVGLPSAPNGLYADGILSVLLTKFSDKWEAERDFNSPHQNFVLINPPYVLFFACDLSICHNLFVRSLQLGNLAFPSILLPDRSELWHSLIGEE